MSVVSELRLEQSFIQVKPRLITFLNNDILDCSRAVDTLNHRLLMSKLEADEIHLTCLYLEKS